MKKILLVVLLALSLHGGEVACQESFKISMTHNVLIVAAIERGDVVARNREIKLTLKWLDRTLAECPADWIPRKTATDLRDFLLTFIHPNSLIARSSTNFFEQIL